MHDYDEEFDPFAHELLHEALAGIFQLTLVGFFCTLSKFIWVTRLESEFFEIITRVLEYLL